MPAPQNAPSGSARGLLVWSMTKVMDASVKQLSNAYLPTLCPWCKDISVIRFVTDTNSTKGAALRKYSSAVLDTSRGGHFSQHAARLEGPIFKTHDRGWELDNLQLLTTLPGHDSYMLNAHCHIHAPEHGCSIEGSACQMECPPCRCRSTCGMLLAEIAACEGRAGPAHSQRHPNQRLLAESRECHLPALPRSHERVQVTRRW